MSQTNIKKVVEALSQIDLEPCLNGDFTELTKIIPDVTNAQVRRALKIIIEHREFREGQDRANEASWGAIFEKYGKGEPKTATLRTLLQKHAERGDGEAQYLLEKLTGCEARVTVALVFAAARKHPDWELDEFDNSLSTSLEFPITEGALIDWFQMTYPAEAKRIEDEVRAGSL